MKQPPRLPVEVERLHRRHDVAPFSSGVAPLDRYLREQASQDARRGFSAVFVAVPSGAATVAAYYTLSMASVSLDAIPEELRRRMPRYPSVPAIRLGRLAVATGAQGQGLGTFLLIDAMHRAMQSEIAWAAFIVDAKDDGAVRSYRQFGFASFHDDARHLYLMRRTIEDLLATVP